MSGTEDKARVVELIAEPGGERRRQALTERIFVDWMHKFSMEHKTDEHGMTSVKLPRNRTGAVTTWDVAFDKQVADDRHAEFVTYTTPRFQRILQQIGRGPVISIHRVRSLDSDEQEGPWDQAECLRLDASFHVEYSSYGDSRSELIVVRVGPDDFESSIVTDAFIRDARVLPDSVGVLVDKAHTRVAKKVEANGLAFCKMVGAKIEAERFRLSNHRDTTAKNKGDQQHHDFFHQAVERTKAALGDKYAIEIRIRLLAIEPFIRW